MYVDVLKVWQAKLAYSSKLQTLFAVNWERCLSFDDITLSGDLCKH